MRPRKPVIIWNAPNSPSTAASPDNCDSAFVKLPPFNPKTVTKFGVKLRAAVEEVVESGGDVALIAVETAGAQRS